jgi:hypothetical protein
MTAPIRLSWYRCFLISIRGKYHAQKLLLIDMKIIRSVEYYTIHPCLKTAYTTPVTLLIYRPYIPYFTFLKSVFYGTVSA